MNTLSATFPCHQMLRLTHEERINHNNTAVALDHLFSVVERIDAGHVLNIICSFAFPLLS